MENPYSASEHACSELPSAQPPARPRWQWKRLLAWSLMAQLTMLVTAAVMGVLSATLMLKLDSPQLYASSVAWLRMVVVDIILACFYAGFLIKVTHRRILHLLMMLVLLVLLDLALSVLVFGVPHDGLDKLGFWVGASAPMFLGAALIWMYERWQRGRPGL